jgi:hypothetical protein
MDGKYRIYAIFLIGYNSITNGVVKIKFKYNYKMYTNPISFFLTNTAYYYSSIFSAHRYEYFRLNNIMYFSFN